MRTAFFWTLRCKCGSDRLIRSRRRSILEKILSVVVRPWRCEYCQERTFKGSWLSVRNPIDRALDSAAQAFDRGTGDADV